MWQHQELQNDGALAGDNGAGGQTLQPLSPRTLSLQPLHPPCRGSPTVAALEEIQCCCSPCWYLQVYIRRRSAEKLHFLHHVVHFCESFLPHGQMFTTACPNNSQSEVDVKRWRFNFMCVTPYLDVGDSWASSGHSWPSVPGYGSPAGWNLIPRLNVMRTYFSVQLLLDICVPVRNVPSL